MALNRLRAKAIANDLSKRDRSEPAPHIVRSPQVVLWNRKPDWSWPGLGQADRNIEKDLLKQESSMPVELYLTWARHSRSRAGISAKWFDPVSFRKIRPTASFREEAFPAREGYNNWESAWHRESLAFRRQSRRQKSIRWLQPDL